ncbi:MAG: myxosortase family intramembrane protease, partial [Polyangiaceae bacterium]
AQLFVIALPEEAFYRGYLQSRLDDVFTSRWNLAGASVTPSIVITSAIFALGHLATVHDPSRLAVFFPSLVFGWLRARTKGVGASIFFHAFCNIFSELLGRGFGLY